MLKAAGTKWNFLPFSPGLVGGHCIGVDPYYLTHKAEAVGYHPEVILAGRRINDSMGKHVAERVVKLMSSTRINIVDARVLVLGLAFKENCPDIRNTKVVDLVSALTSYNLSVDVYDPWVDADEATSEYGLETISEPQPNTYDAIVLAVAHQQFIHEEFKIPELGRSNHIVYDVKGILPQNACNERL